MKHIAAESFDADAAVFRKADEKDIPAITAILKSAVERMLAEGKQQWNHNYPNETHVREDVARGVGYVMQCNGVVVAYAAVVFDGEPAYADIRGKWLADEPYVVVHRMAVLPSSQRRGWGLSFLNSVEALALSKGIRSFRVDTNHDNIRMLSLLKKAGFALCGEISYQSGSRMAFEKVCLEDGLHADFQRRHS